MEDSQSDDEANKNISLNLSESSTPSSPSQPTKKFKHDSASSSAGHGSNSNNQAIEQDTEVPTIVSEENVDSGICADKPECSTAEDPKPATSTLNNEPAEGTPSTSTFKWMMDIEKYLKSKKDRNYRKQSARAGDSTDSDDHSASHDSDDLSAEDSNVNLFGIVHTSPLAALRTSVFTPHLSRDSDGTASRSPSRMSFNGSDGLSNNEAADNEDNSSNESDTDIDEWTDMESSTNNEDTNSDYETPPVLLKRKPDHNWFIVPELMKRQMGYGIGPGKVARTDVLFEQRCYGSLHAVYRLELMCKLNKHKGCVNSINFHPEGHLIASGSDDLTVVVWDWTINKPRVTLKTEHKSNVFQSRFLYLNSRSQLNIVTCARDGQVRLIQCPPSGATTANVVRRRLAQHSRPAHKLHVWPSEPHLVMSAGEDGVVILADVRMQESHKLLSVRGKSSPVRLYTIHGHPLDPNELVVAGGDSFVRVYDRRQAGDFAKPTSTFCPSFFLNSQENTNARKKLLKNMSLYVTCAVYNHNGSEILASYNDDDIYLFDTIADRYVEDSMDTTKVGFSQRYSGHRNSATIKGVSFFGPHSEFVVSGSDCSNIYIWDKKTEAIVQWMLGDEGGVVNCIECHPRFPILATSGIDKDVKIWVPSNEKDPMLNGLREAVSENGKAQLRSPLFNDLLPSLYTMWSRASDERPPRRHSGVELDGNMCTMS